MPCYTSEDLTAIEAEIVDRQALVDLATAAKLIADEALVTAQNSSNEAESNLMNAQMLLSELQTELQDAQNNACPA